MSKLEAIISAISCPAPNPAELQAVLNFISAEREATSAAVREANNRRRGLLLTAFTPEQLAAVEQEVDHGYLTLERLELAETVVIEHLGVRAGMSE